MKKIINDFVPMGGGHCISNSLKQVFHYYGYPLSEAMIFGIGTGISFMYLNMEHSPMVSGRVNVFDLENQLEQRLHIKLSKRKSDNCEKVFHKAKDMIDHNQPVLIYVDMPYMSYLHMDENSHFGGHSIILFGYDDEEECFYVSDRDNNDYSIRTPIGPMSMDYHKVPYKEIEMARTSKFRPFPANNKYVEFDFGNQKIENMLNKDILTKAIVDACEGMQNPPTKMLGLSGIEKFAKEVKKWRHFDDDKLKTTGITNYFQISKDGGTGGGIFRRMYGEFLIEVNGRYPELCIEDIGQTFICISEKWDGIAQSMWKLFETGNRDMLPIINSEIMSIYDKERVTFAKLSERMKIH